MIPFPIVDTLHETLRGDMREPDGLLHCSGDLVGSLRHAQLRAAGAPTIASELISDVRLRTGTMWHEYVAHAFQKRGMPFMAEVNLTPWLPEGWAGTADWIFFDPERRAFVLGDLKTSKGEAMFWIEKGGIKEPHLWQLSAYWYALKRMGLPRLLKSVSVLYLPMNNVPKEQVEPVILEAEPLPEEQVVAVMTERWEATQKYFQSLTALDDDERWDALPRDKGRVQDHWRYYLTEALAPPIEREQKVFWNARMKVFDVKLTPHWITKFCPYPNELCDCSEQGYTKIGHFGLHKEGSALYEPRKGYEDTELTVSLDAKQISKLREGAA